MWGLHSAAVIVVLGSAAIACGGRVSDGDDVTTKDVGADGDDASETWSDAPPAKFEGGCTLPNGVPLCRGTLKCPISRPETCSFDCIEFNNRNDDPGPFGICLREDGSKVLELARAGDYYRCGVCGSEGALCVGMLAFPRLFCADPAICSWLADAGYSDACWYQDKTPWKRGASIPAPACPPSGRAAGLCGGACGACSDGRVCTGRSPTHPFGICAQQKNESGEQNICGRRPGEPPKLDPRGCPSGQRCLVWASSDQSVADPHGFCVAETACSTIKSVIPGGVSCYTPTGSE